MIRVKAVALHVHMPCHDMTMSLMIVGLGIHELVRILPARPMTICMACLWPLINLQFAATALAPARPQNEMVRYCDKSLTLCRCDSTVEMCLVAHLPDLHTKDDMYMRICSVYIPCSPAVVIDCSIKLPNPEPPLNT